jgi:hypothetical protein
MDMQINDTRDFSGSVSLDPDTGEIKAVFIEGFDVADYNVDTYFSLLGGPWFEGMGSDDPVRERFETEDNLQ